MDQIFKKKYIISTIFISLLLIIFFFIKYKFFSNLFPRTDQSFYIKWIIDLSNSKYFFPLGDENFYLNLTNDNNSFLHNYFRRIYNDVGVIYNFIPLLLNYICAKIISYSFLTYNTLSILLNCFIPLLITQNILGNKELNLKKYLYSFTLLYAFISSFFSLFFLAPLGIHNYSIFFLVLSVIIFEKNINKKNFINLEVIFLGILLPSFAHKFNVIIILSSVFFIIIFRFFSKLEIKKDLIFSLLIFSLIISPILFFSLFGERNLELLKIFFTGGNKIVEKNFLQTILFYLSENIFVSLRIFFVNLWNYLGLLGIIILFLSVLNMKFKTIKIYLMSTFLLFVFLPLDPYLDRLFNYFLIISIFLICSYSIDFILGNKIFEKVIHSLIVFILIFNTIPIFFENYQNNFQKKLSSKYPNNKIWKEKIDKVIDIVGNENILFYQYLARDVYFSNFNKYDQKKQVYLIPSVYDLSNKYIQNDINYLKMINFDKSKFKDTYILFFGDTKFEKDLNERFCFLQKEFFGKCSNLKIVNYSTIKKPLKYEGDTHFYVLNLYKTLN